MVWRLNPSRGKTSHTLPDQSQDPPSLLYNGYRVSFPGVKWLGRDTDHQPLSNAEVVYGLNYTSTFPLCLHDT